MDLIPQRLRRLVGPSQAETRGSSPPRGVQHPDLGHSRLSVLAHACRL